MKIEPSFMWRWRFSLDGGMNRMRRQGALYVPPLVSRDFTVLVGKLVVMTVGVLVCGLATVFLI